MVHHPAAICQCHEFQPNSQASSETATLAERIGRLRYKSPSRDVVLVFPRVLQPLVSGNGTRIPNRTRLAIARHATPGT